MNIRATALVAVVVSAAAVVAGAGGYAAASHGSAAIPVAHAIHRPAAKPAKPAPSKPATTTPPPAAVPAPAAQPAAPAAPAPAPADPAPAAPQPQLTDAAAVVVQYYSDLNNQDYADAWALGGDNLNGGTGYAQWVAGYDTTASITLTTYGQWNDGTVWCNISAVQTDGTTRTYYGTYTVSGGVIISANVQQTS